VSSGQERPPVTSVRPGDVLAGKYRVERVLGVGGMGVVVAAHHLGLNETVALKFLLPEALGSPDAVARFLREAQAAVKIKSEHVASIKDVGTLPNGAPFMVMEYLDGSDLADWIKQRGALPIEQAVEFVIQACVAVAEAHGLRIIHRDLKPANLFCLRRADGQLSIKVLDFGISKMTDPTGSGMAMTRTTAMMGTPLYVSPEQMRSAKDVDERTDIWALGVILFELMTGRPPFLAESIMELAAKIVTESPPSLRTLRPDAPEGLEAAIFKCLEKDRALRYRNVGELALAIVPFAPKRAKPLVERISGIIQAAGLSGSPVEVPRSPTIDATLPAEGTLQPTGRTTLGATKGKSAVLSRGFAGAVLATVGITLAIYAWRGGTHRDAEGKNAPAQPASTTVVTPSTPTKAPEAPLPAATSQGLPVPAVATVAATASDASSRPQSPASAARSGAGHGPPPAPGTPVANQTSPPPAGEPPHPGAVVKPAAPDCTIPFTIDSRGHHVPKPECL
jgi:eukaryotic-like serine/threonine-protein kinase